MIKISDHGADGVNGIHSRRIGNAAADHPPTDIHAPRVGGGNL